MNIAVIALLHALPVYLLARLTRNRWVLLIAAVGSAALGFYVGGGQYAVYDILAISIAVILAWPLTRQLPEGQLEGIGRSVASVSVAAAHTTGRVAKMTLKGFIWLVFIGFFGAIASKMIVGGIRGNWEDEDRRAAAAAEKLSLIEVKNRCYVLHQDAKKTGRLKLQREADQVCTVYERRAEPLRPRLDGLLQEAQQMTKAIHRQCMAHHRNKKANSQYRDDAMDLACDDYKTMLERAAAQPKGGSAL